MPQHLKVNNRRGYVIRFSGNEINWKLFGYDPYNYNLKDRNETGALFHNTMWSLSLTIDTIYTHLVEMPIRQSTWNSF